MVEHHESRAGFTGAKPLKISNDYLYTALFAVILFAVYGGVYLLWRDAPVVYSRVMVSWGVVPWSYPFFDTQAVLSWIDCHQQGFDVTVTNPCDPLNRALGYSPLILDFPAWVRVADTQPVGLILDSGFLLALALFFRPESGRDIGRACLAVLSTSVVFAMERGNFDVLIFTLVGIAIWFCQNRKTLRLVSYPILLFAGLLKFYPLVLLATSVRERPRVFWAIVTATAVILVAFGFTHWTALRRVLAILPPLELWGDTFGAREIFLALPYLWPNSFAAELALGLVLCLVFLGVLARTFNALQHEQKSLTANQRETDFLFFGSLLIAGCFFAGTNVGYRAIFLMFALPGLWETRRRAVDPFLATVLKMTSVAIMLLLWKDFLRTVVTVALARISGGAGAGPVWGYLTFFLLRELTWWFVIAVLAAVALSFLWNSLTVRAFRSDVLNRIQRLGLRPNSPA